MVNIVIMVKVILIEANSQIELNEKVNKYLNKGYDLFLDQKIDNETYQQPVFKR